MADASTYQPWTPWAGSHPPHHTRRKLTPHQIDEIRQALADGDTTVQELAAKYGVSTHTIRRYQP
jgi:DNA invertase Pin-like site-specific DNA recombinase